MPVWLVDWVNRTVPPKAHFIVIHGKNATIDAYVSFYREPLISKIRLTSSNSGESFKVGLFCDWKARKEQKFFAINYFTSLQFQNAV
jgi:hypothetical protein